MKADLARKSTRTVYGDKVVRVELDIPYEEIKEAEKEGQSFLEWLDNKVDREVSFTIGPFEDEDQTGLPELEKKAKEVMEADKDELTELDEV